uniref:Uncharacterized protein n=1 Tax=Pithovirus LCPAC101 TaxID=2506586 RepID=A0A481Z3L8_9VIRU|nr:MAG: hypothetical protein LCPAC101_02440 [Pithovirus LCPAC101]
MYNKSEISHVLVDALILSLLSVKELSKYRIYKVNEKINDRKKTNNIEIKLFHTNTYEYSNYNTDKKKIPVMKFISSIKSYLTSEHDETIIRVNQIGIYIVVTFILEGGIKINNNYNYRASINDGIWGLKMRTYYPHIYKILYNKYGYSWKQYYNSIIRFPWLAPYFYNPNIYIDSIISLLHYFAGIDEICLFDIVYKGHVNISTKYKSKLDMRYKMKNKFIIKCIEPQIPVFGMQSINTTLPNPKNKQYHILFDNQFRYEKEYMHKLNYVSYLKLELRFDQMKLMHKDYIYSDLLIKYIEHDNDLLVDYLLATIVTDKILIKYLGIIYDSVSKSNLKERENILTQINNVYDTYKMMAMDKYNTIHNLNDLGDLEDVGIFYNQKYSGYETEEVDLPPVVFLDDNFY